MSSPYGPYGLGHSRATVVITNKSENANWSKFLKIAEVQIVFCNSKT